MSDENKQINTAKIVAYISTFMVLVVVSYSLYYHFQVPKKLTYYETKIQDFSELKERFINIKNSADLLKRDMSYYITARYQRVPQLIANEISEHVVTLAKQNHLPPELVLAIIEIESNFNPMAVSSQDARGLMQVMPEWVPKMGLSKVRELHDIDTNIRCGIEVLKVHIFEDAKGSITKGLYYYVGKSDSYAPKVYEAMGRFVAFRATIDDTKITNGSNGEGENVNGVDNGATGDNQ